MEHVSRLHNLLSYRSDRDCCKKELGGTKFRRRKTGDLTKDIEPSGDPADGWHPFGRCYARNSVVSGTVRHSNAGSRMRGITYKPPEVGYAETSSATEDCEQRISTVYTGDEGCELTAMHMHPNPEISQHQTADGAPPP